jgi:N-hydroxyarylamine O-acetyltransferase
MRDIDAYLERVGLSGRPHPFEVHRAQGTSIPFENLDPHGGRPVSLDPEDIERKLVHEGRGGYCFELNLLLHDALATLGADVDMFLARTRLGAPPGVVRPRTHLVLRASVDGESVLADAGFGMGTLFDPMPFAPGAESEQLGWHYRLREDGPEWVLETREGEGWTDVYGFVPEPAPMIDLETSSWYVSTHPRSPFVTGLIFGIQGGDGTRTALTDWGELALTVSTPAERRVTQVERREIPGLLSSRFGIEGFELASDGRLRRAGG